MQDLKNVYKLFKMAGTMGLMIVSTTLTSDLLSQLIFRLIFTNFATIFSHSTFSSFGTHFMKSADIVNEICILSFRSHP